MPPPKTKKNLKTKLSEEFRSYCKHSTMHGLYYLYKSSSRAVKTVWITILCCCAALTCVLGFKIWKQYVIDPTVTVVESTHYPTSDISYPAVVLCDSHLVYGPNSEEITDILLRRGYKNPDIDLFYESIEDGSILTPEQYHRMFVIHRLLMDLGIQLQALLDMLVKPCDVLLVKCIWRSNEHNCSEMFRKVLTFRGYCCRFDIDYFREHAANNTNFMSYPERTKAMELVLNGKKIYSNGTAVDGTAEMFVFDPADRLTVMDSPVSLAAGTYFDVSIDLSAVEASSDVKALPREVRRCMLPDDSESGSSFYSGCVSNVLMHEVVKRCKCVPYFQPTSGDLEGYATCNWDRIKCVLESRQSFSGSPAELQSFQNCFQKCDYVKYDAQVQSFELNRPLTDVNQSHLYEETNSEMSIHFADRTCLKYKREVLFTWDQMLANIGGIFGLCMGGSIISVIEIVWLVIDLIYVCVTDKITRKVSPQGKTKINDIFAVSKGKPDKVSWNEKCDTKNNQNGQVFVFTH